MQPSALQFVSPSEPRWNSFLEGRPEANIFHHPAWSQLMAETYGYRPQVLAHLASDSSVDGGLPLMEVNSALNGKRWVSLPFSDHCIPLCHDRHILEGFIERLAHLAEGKSITTVELRAPYPELAGVQLGSEHVIHRIDLSPGIAHVYDRIHKMHRRNVKTAEESGITIRLGKGMDGIREFYRLHLRTRRYQGVPVQPWKFFQGVQRLLIDGGHGLVLLAYQDERCVAGAVFLHWKRTMMYKFGASDRSSLKSKPNDLIMWEAIRWACAHGYEVFDMGRTEMENEGLRSFKSRWGAVEEPLYYSVLSAKPVQPSKGRLDRILHSVIQHSPLWVCRLSGELLYRHVG